MEDINNANIAISGTNLVDASLQKNLAFGNFLTEDKILVDLGLKKIRDKNYLKKINSISEKCYFDEITEVNYASGAALMIRKNVIDILGLFNPKFHMYYEDMELCFRYKKKGYKTVIIIYNHNFTF